jgi:hypothetical protein
VQATRIYIANQVLGTVVVTDRIPAGRTIGQFFDLGPTVDNRPPPRGLVTDLVDHLAEYPCHYTAADLAFLTGAPLGCVYQKCWHESGARWETLE